MYIHNCIHICIYGNAIDTAALESSPKANQHQNQKAISIEIIHRIKTNE